MMIGIFTQGGRIHSTTYATSAADGVVMAGKIANFYVPTENARAEFDPDFTVWMDTIEASRYARIPKPIFEKPINGTTLATWFTDTPQLVDVVKTWMERNAF